MSAGKIKSTYKYEVQLLKLVKTGDHKLLNRLISLGADVNTEDSNGNTALAIAAKFNRFNCVNSLIAAGADVNMSNNEGI